MNRVINASVALEPIANNILNVWLDSSNRSVNVLDADMLAGLSAVMEHVEREPGYRAIVFRSRKASGFFAGADAHAIAALFDTNIAKSAVEQGQGLMQRISQLSVPSIAAVDGMCMGGGLELALSCRYRVASDALATRLGFPEIKLGLIPGWGGTQRLPQLVGIRKALQLILKGNSLSAADALDCGLVDELLAKDTWDEDLAELVERVASSRFAHPLKSITLVDRWLERTRLGRSLVVRETRRRIAGEAGRYPATVSAIKAIVASYRRGIDGYAVERDEFAKLLFTPTARSLLGLFMQRDRAKRVSTWIDSDEGESPRGFSRVAVIGAGAMGAAIGGLVAVKGYQVIFKELDDATAEAGRRRLDDLLAAQVDRQRLSSADRQAAMRRVSFTSSWEQLGDCDLAIEAVLEKEKVKHHVFAELNSHVPRDAVLASNTSSLSITRMAQAAHRLGSVAGLHFFHPVDRMELVEVVRSEACDAAVIQRLLHFVRALGKTPIVTSDKPGFLVNRVLFPYLGEAVRMVAEGCAIQDIDRELRAFGMPMGPLELIDQVGVDIACHVAGSLAEMQPSARLPAEFLRDMVDHGWLGKKTNQGFYQYRSPKRRVARDFGARQKFSVSHNSIFQDDGLSAIQRRLVYALLNEAVHCLDEFVVSEPWMVDLGMVLGTGFAPHHGGPLRLIDTIGVGTVKHNLVGLMQLYGDRFHPADGIVRHARSATPFIARPLEESASEQIAESSNY